MNKLILATQHDTELNPGVHLCHDFKKQNGAATLIIIVILLIAAMLAFIYASSNNVMQQKSAANQYVGNQSFQAAEAGLEFGLAYLNANIATIQGSASGGFINYGSSNVSLTNVGLSNSSKYSIVYTNPTQNNYDLLLVKSTGVSADGTATHVVQQLVYATPTLSYAATTLSNFSAAGGGTITGTTHAIDAGGSISTAGWNTTGETLTPNDATLSGLTGSQLFSLIFGMTEAQMQAQSAVYSNAGSTPWATLNGDVWFNNNLSLAGSYTVGTVVSPVLLFINGNFSIAGNFTLNGILFVNGTTSAAGTLNINGALISTGSISAAGALTFNAPIVKQLSGGTYAKVPGSWKDF